MLLIEKIFTYLTSAKVGGDEFGNGYYQSRFRKDYLGNRVRYVLYRGKEEPSKVPPMWHAWLHHLREEVPVSDNAHYKWEKAFLPNLTGTKFAYNPVVGSKRKEVSNDYISWVPGGKK